MLPPGILPPGAGGVVPGDELLPPRSVEDGGQGAPPWADGPFPIPGVAPPTLGLDGLELFGGNGVTGLEGVIVLPPLSRQLDGAPGAMDGLSLLFPGLLWLNPGAVPTKTQASTHTAIEIPFTLFILSSSIRFCLDCRSTESRSPSPKTQACREGVTSVRNRFHGTEMLRESTIPLRRGGPDRDRKRALHANGPIGNRIIDFTGRGPLPFALVQ